jgi:hypothetical protein
LHSLISFFGWPIEFLQLFAAYRAFLCVIENTEQAETGTMPSHDIFGLDHDKGISPSRPKSVKKDPEQLISGSEPRARMFSVEHAQLLTQG